MELDNIIIKESDAKDLNNIIEIEKQAFGYDKEAELTVSLLNDKSASTPYTSTFGC